MKITIVGCGPIGGLFATQLTDAGEDVTLVGTNDQIVEAIQKEGLMLETSTGESKKVTVKITKDITTAGISELVMIAVKSHSTRSAMEGALSIVGKDTYILSLQNGAGNIETIAEILGDESRVIGGSVYYSVSPLKPNHLFWVLGTGGLKMAPMCGVMNPKIEEVAQVVRHSGIEVTTSTNVQDLIWNKLLTNSCLCLLTVLKMTNDEYLKHPSTSKLVPLIANEFVEVGRAKDINFENPEDPTKPILDIMQTFKTSGKKMSKPSMLQDLERGRRTEIDAINGTVVNEGKKLGIPTPVNEVFVLLVKAIEEATLNIK